MGLGPFLWPYVFIKYLQNNKCLSSFHVECNAGYYYDQATPLVCQPCPVGTYKPKSNLENCQECPEGKMTFGNGSISCFPIVGKPRFGTNYSLKIVANNIFLHWLDFSVVLLFIFLIDH